MSAAQGNVHVGISGWRYPPWRGGFYPEKLPQRDELAYAAKRFSSIEINGSFYSLQSPELYDAWRDQTPPNFVFAVKGSRYITHMLKLRNIRVPLANLFASGPLRLRAKLGPFLWQFPPQLAFDEARFGAFFELLPRTMAAAAKLAAQHDDRLDGRAGYEVEVNLPLRHAAEIRHPSFVCPEFIALLRRHNIALVVADTAGRWPLIEDATADFAYLRLHGDKELYASGYEESAMVHWAHRIRSWRDGDRAADEYLAAPNIDIDREPRDVFCYFDNDIKVNAPFDALNLVKHLDRGAAT